MQPPVLEMPKVTPKMKDGISLAGGDLRLNLGGAGEGYRSGRIPGFLTVDLRDVPDTDIISDVSDLGVIADNTVETLYASNVLEHFPHVRTVGVLKEWHRVLKPGGKAYISVPDFDATVKIYLREGLVPWVQYLAWGDQAHPLNYHYINFTFATLAKACVDAGFSDVKRISFMPFGVKDASQLADSHSGILISLNVEAIA